MEKEEQQQQKKKPQKLVKGKKDQSRKKQQEIKEKIVKTNKTKSWFFEKIKLTNLQTDSSRKKNQINKIRNEKEVTIDNEEIQWIIRDYYEQIYGNKMGSLEEIDRFLEKFNLSRLNQEEIEIMNNPITSTEIEDVIYETAKETLMYRTVLWTLWERERVGRFGRMAMKHIKYHVGNEKKKNKIKK